MNDKPTDIPRRIALSGADHNRASAQNSAPATVTTRTIQEFNTWYEQHTHGSTLAVGGRYETRNGRMFCLGGLSWSLHIRAFNGSPVTVVLATAENEPLPNLPVVRAGFPYGLDHNTPLAVAA